MDHAEIPCLDQGAQLLVRSLFVFIEQTRITSGENGLAFEGQLRRKQRTVLEKSFMILS